jgi:hypothetical protein
MAMTATTMTLTAGKKSVAATNVAAKKKAAR